MTLIPVGFAVLALASAPQTPDDAPPVAQQGTMMLEVIDFYAKGARRDRYVRSSFNLGLSGTQLGLGIYGLTGIEGADQGLRRAAVTQIVTGSLGLASSIVSFAARSPMERLYRSDTYASLAATPDDPRWAEQLRLNWKTAAEAARRRRYIQGGITIAAGTLLTVATSIRLAAADSDTGNNESAWSLSTLISGLGVMTSGIVRVILPGEEERSFAAYEAGLAPQRRHVRVSPFPGGMTIRGRF